MKDMFAERISSVPKSFIREILKAASSSSVISFAGGLPNKKLFPVEQIKRSAEIVFEQSGSDALQYSNSEGCIQLRKFISERYLKKQNLKIPVENILITNGSQQGLDLIGKVFINKYDDIVIEKPGYLGAIQAFSVYQPTFNCVDITNNGLDVGILSRLIQDKNLKLIYTVPNFQNPSGVCYSESNRRAVAQCLCGADILLVEDDPYRDLRYEGDSKTSFKELLPNNTLMLGSFSKIIAPSFRIGWVVAGNHFMDKLVVAKQASDLHTNYISQRIIMQYLTDNDLDLHIEILNESYNEQRMAMLNCIKKYFPDEVGYTEPEGGMFVWVCLPREISSLDLLRDAMVDDVVFVPGHPFYVNLKDVNTLRLNFSCVDADNIEKGIRRLGKIIKKHLRITHAREKPSGMF